MTMMNPFSNTVLNAMSFLKNLFSSSNKSDKVECPRCLGKGYVDQADIIRLKRELKWLPGSCAFCNGTGKVPPGRTELVPADTTYLSSNLTGREQRKLFNGDAAALERARQYDAETDKLIAEIRKLYFEEQMQVPVIANFYFDKYPHHFLIEERKQEFIDFIKKVITIKG